MLNIFLISIIRRDMDIFDVLPKLGGCQTETPSYSRTTHGVNPLHYRNWGIFSILSKLKFLTRWTKA